MGITYTITDKIRNKPLFWHGHSNEKRRFPQQIITGSQGVKRDPVDHEKAEREIINDAIKERELEDERQAWRTL